MHWRCYEIVMKLVENIWLKQYSLSEDLLFDTLLSQLNLGLCFNFNITFSQDKLCIVILILCWKKTIE